MQLLRVFYSCWYTSIPSLSLSPPFSHKNLEINTERGVSTPKNSVMNSQIVKTSPMPRWLHCDKQRLIQVTDDIVTLRHKTELFHFPSPGQQQKYFPFFELSILLVRHACYAIKHVHCITSWKIVIKCV